MSSCITNYSTCIVYITSCDQWIMWSVDHVTSEPCDQDINLHNNFTRMGQTSDDVIVCTWTLGPPLSLKLTQYDCSSCCHDSHLLYDAINYKPITTAHARLHVLEIKLQSVGATRFLVWLPDNLPCAGCMAPEHLHNKGDHIRFTKLLSDEHLSTASWCFLCFHNHAYYVVYVHNKLLTFKHLIIKKS